MITGIGVLPESDVRATAGVPPQGLAERDAWAKEATRRVVAAYQARSYAYARAWYLVEPSGRIHLHLDEGRMRVIYTGVSSVVAFLFSLDFYLPRGVFHEPSLRRGLERLKRKHDLLNIYYRVKEPGEYNTNVLGKNEPQRVLQIYVVTPDAVGWGFDMRSSPTWGLLPGVSYTRRSLLWAGDRLRAKAEVGFPYRRYLLDIDPKFQWVHGGLEFEYTLPRMVGRRLAPRLDSSIYVSRPERLSLGLASYHLLRTPTLASLVLFLPGLELSLGGGVEVLRAFLLDPAPGPPPLEPVPGPATSVRGLARLGAKLEARSEVLRRDWRTFLALRCDLIASGAQRWMFQSELVGQLFRGFGRHRFFVSGRGLLLAGDVRFWDDVALASDFQRVFFGNRYWVRGAGQLETAYRINLWWYWFDLGVFHDLSVFADRTRPERPVAVANAFGPSIHFLLFDLFALDLFAGFGFAPVGFDHTLSLSLQTIF
ncbi:MAG: hypothetical protein IT371_14025 [Deltaproteobacteria bacterium]|nr:hypothetical protein [Deltaproteobacteria bacterium]